MVTIIDYTNSVNKEGKLFHSLKIQGGIEMILSEKTRRYYASAKRATISCTFDEATCGALIGTTMPGKIEKETCASYEYTIKETGEVIQLSHRYVYVPENEEKNTTRPAERISDIVDESVFSKNGRSLEMA